MRTKHHLTIAIIGLGLVFVGVSNASAAPAHPRRAEVNHRLAIENARINRNLAKGNITKEEAAELRGEVRAVRVQERQDAAEHGGHITKAEQRQLNQQENALSRQIYEKAH